MKLEASDIFNEDTVPIYDLIILDEIESILKQFNSIETFKNKSRNTFEFIDEIIKSSVLNGGKIISMDGDLGNRTVNFLKDYGNMINIINNVNFNSFKLNITSNLDYFENCIFLALDANKNIVIPTMSAGYANQIYTTIKDRYPDLNILIYTSASGGEDKMKLKNVDELWRDANVLIYSPTISAGVSFDKKHFDVIFGVLCDGSCTPRDYHQMLRRIRKIEDNDILILNYSKFQIHHNVKYTSYEDAKNYCLKVKDVNLKREYKKEGNTTKILYQLDKYDETYIYNKAEEMNSQREVFLSQFLSLALKKHYKVELLDDIDKYDDYIKNTEHRSNWRIDELLSVPDISNKEAQILQDKTNKLLDTKDDKLKLDRYYIRLKLGVDTVDETILKDYHYKYHRILNFTALLDDNNIPFTNDNHHDELRFKTSIIRELINKLGFADVYDTDKKYNKEEIITSINNLMNINIFTQDKDYYKMFSTSEYKLKKLFEEESSLKNKLGYINSILADFSLKISLNRKQEKKGNKTHYYNLTHLNNITEIIENKIKKGFEIHGLFKPPTSYKYNHLVINQVDKSNIYNYNDWYLDDDITTTISTTDTLHSVDDEIIEIDTENKDIKLLDNKCVNNDKLKIEEDDALQQTEHMITSSVHSIKQGNTEYLTRKIQKFILFDE